jgi:amino acid adenylation domain-containing protein
MEHSLSGGVWGEGGSTRGPLTEHERRQLLAWNATQQDFPQEFCIPQLVERQAQATPGAPALFMGDRMFTYGQLNEQANRLARRLQACGVGPNVLVGICLERSFDLVVGLLAILKAGGAYVALDPSYPSERLIFMLEDAGLSVLVARRHTAARLSLTATKLVCPEDGGEVAQGMCTANPTAPITAEDVAYVVYTSGSTGQPKGVEVTHRSLLNLVFWHQQTFEIKACDRATQFASSAFDVSGEELWPHLAAGASVSFIDEDIRFQPRAIRNWLVEHAITIAILPTALVESLIALEWPACSLRVMLTGGDVLHRYPPAHLPFALFNNYGPSETTVVATCGRVFPAQDTTTPPSIGRPIANTQVYILDERLRQVPVEEVGELYIGGAGVARGYLSRPQVTLEKFIPDPFSCVCGARMYRTGDLGKYLADGQIAFMGRSDFQINLRGYRIEPNEIMQLLNGHPAIETSMVMAREDTPGNRRLVAYIRLLPTAHVTVSSLRAAVLQHLPEYMLPSLFVVLDTFPLNANGKVDLSALPVPDASNILRDEPGAAPSTLTEKRVAAGVASLLHLQQVGIDDNFFALGGHSLQAIELMNNISTTFSIDVPVATLFETNTLRQLAAEIERLLVTKLDLMSEDEVIRLLQ